VLYSFLDIAFLVLHSLLIVFNLFGWAWQRTRRLNLLLTVGSWLIFAPWYGLGYCPCTDWHWQVKDALGQTDLPNNYRTYLLYAWTGILHLPVPIRTRAVAEAIPWSEDKPTADCEQEVEAAGSLPCPSEQVEDDEEAVQDEEGDVKEGVEHGGA
jgi:hypothetical protein